jgi:hypothetical protein
MVIAGFNFSLTPTEIKKGEKFLEYYSLKVFFSTVRAQHTKVKWRPHVSGIITQFLVAKESLAHFL